MLLPPRRQRSFPAWFGIFAILAISIAPVISQTLVHRNHGTAQALSASATEHHHAVHGVSGAHNSSQTRHSSPPNPASMADHNACGYCALFSYTPALPEIHEIIVALTRYFSHARVILCLSCVIPFEKFSSPAPRAPPY
ncbi:DUF2946 domain-containing protein [Brenneria izadpanahii]|uniref:DUF2946 domain-containing protein n=1 Tax=Brenneria izadpanahii TaxID=2722756 RepID=A0ABX7UTB7_9GAMM|nr:DUF2946 domain-containing protein [Brenneria izadpanahii]QTF08829.1 DUF2946 domain-containing protein [Brenneria izadpanahii]